MKISKHQITNNPQKGYLAISSILIVSAVVLAITISVSYLSIGEGQASLAQLKGEQEYYLVESCAEDILVKLRSNPNSSGGEILPEGNCNVMYSQDQNKNYTIYVYSDYQKLYRSFIEIRINRDYSITLSYWRRF